MWSHLSKEFGGRTSDKMITKKSGIMEKLLPDQILADKGFDVDDLAVVKFARG